MTTAIIIAEKLAIILYVLFFSMKEM